MSGTNRRVRFNVQELSGSLGDVGTDLPLLLAMIPAAGLDGASVFIIFGLLQIATGFIYGLPMPMQPLKAMAVIVISGKVTGSVLAGGGLSIGIVMLLLALTGALDWIARVVPRPVVRGVQAGLGLKLAQLAIGDYAAKSGWQGWSVAGGCFAALLALRGNRKVPPAAAVMVAGLLWAAFTEVDFGAMAANLGVHLPVFQPISWTDLWTGFWLLALPQLPLSLSNSVIATKQTVGDLFPERPVTVRGIGLTYALANLVAPWFGGIPVCHGCGGLAGHHAMGGRTGGSVVLYGSYFVLAGLLLGAAVDQVVAIFPKPVLGAVLMVEALTLLVLIRDSAAEKRDFSIMLIVALLALAAPHGFLVGMLVGIAVERASRRWAFLG